MDLEKSDKLDKFGNRNSFTVPENYFETIEERVHSRIGQKVTTKVYQLKPMSEKLAIAAIFIGVLFAVAMLFSSPKKTTKSYASQQMQNDSDLTVASKELIKSLSNTSISIEAPGPKSKNSHVSTKSASVNEVSDDEIIDYMVGNELEPLLVDL